MDALVILVGIYTASLVVLMCACILPVDGDTDIIALVRKAIARRRASVRERRRERRYHRTG